MAQSTRVDDAYRSLRRDILSGRHLPGAKLLSASLREEYDISSGVLREVLPRLAGEGLVVSEPQRGFRVIQVSVSDLRQLTEARVLVETAALRQAIERGDLQWETRVVAAHHTLAGSTPRDDAGNLSDEWLLAHSNFHEALLSGSPNQRLQRIASQLRDTTELYRCWSNRLGDEPDRDIEGEHRRIFEAAIAREADCAASLLTEHYEHTTQIMIRLSESLG
ncbi:GntR family transcriptional regulator [Rhodococcus sp. OK302]|uniref:GntR family transcriptional regulator n=1 Tax=Rhodococcus sp. OK302 TaxID=1882769 RepID=UPI000B945EA6|nr:GntR family transcriptional regulator [Rhodococcus sp. OK302]OYD70993.1 DNA-binding GntR family transcriptional regulator [Rhodococcus sp. OK302]